MRSLDAAWLRRIDFGVRNGVCFNFGVSFMCAELIGDIAGSWQRRKRGQPANWNDRKICGSRGKRPSSKSLTCMYRVGHTTELLFLCGAFSSLDGNWNRVLFKTDARGTFCDETGVENMTWAPFKCSFTGASSSDNDLNQLSSTNDGWNE